MGSNGCELLLAQRTVWSHSGTAHKLRGPQARPAPCCSRTRAARVAASMSGSQEHLQWEHRWPMVPLYCARLKGVARPSSACVESFHLSPWRLKTVFRDFCALYSSTSTWRGRLGNSRYSLDTYCHISTPRRRRRRRGSVIRTSWIVEVDSLEVARWRHNIRRVRLACKLLSHSLNGFTEYQPGRLVRVRRPRLPLPAHQAALRWAGLPGPLVPTCVCRPDQARGVQGLRASRRARLDCPARDSRIAMQVPAGAEGASVAAAKAAAAPLRASIRASRRA